jgi:hypothetical protein
MLLKPGLGEGVLIERMIMTAERIHCTFVLQVDDNDDDIDKESCNVGRQRRAFQAIIWAELLLLNGV